MKRSLSNFDQTELVGQTHVDQTSGIVCYKHGEALANLGEYTKALANFNQAIALRPNYDAAWVFRGVVLIHLEQYQEALLSCDRAIEICPAQAEAWIFRGVALQRLGRYSEAYASYDRAAGRQPGSLWQKLKQRGLHLFWHAWVKPLIYRN